MGPAGGGTIQITFTNDPYATYTVLTTTNAAAPPAAWTVAGQPAYLGNGVFQFAAPRTNAQQFYRVTSP